MHLDETVTNMPVLNLRFSIELVGLQDVFPAPHGLLFSYWLPDGENDAVTLDAGNPDIRLSVWFDRYGSIGTDGLIHYDQAIREVDSDVVPRQAVLDAGPLHGRLILTNVPQEQLELIEGKR